MRVDDLEAIRARAKCFVESCRLQPGEFAFSSYPGGQETLYASAMAVMTLQTLGQLTGVPYPERQKWIAYLNRWQDAETGLFIGPELTPADLTNPQHDFDTVSWHLTAHVLPALSLLGGSTAHPLRFAHRLLDESHLRRWLAERDWTQAWKEGNNLIAAAQFLIWLREREGISKADHALNYFFSWLDSQIDPATGLWGTDHGCNPFYAMYGAYHQLLAYYYEGRPLPWAEKLIDTTLALQHEDGGFHPAGGGGACEDTDGIDILVNLYKITAYKRPHIRRALRRAVPALLGKHLPDGGFAYRLNEPFIHMGIRRTQTAPNVGNMFATWFRLHALALIGQILTDHPVGQVEWGFNNTCSMGWHRPWSREAHRLTRGDRLAELVCAPATDMRRLIARSVRQSRHLAGRFKRRLLAAVEIRHA
jgi:hypothetical protein